MAQRTLSSMHDARDAEDKRLLDEGEHKALLASYFEIVRERCFVRLHDSDAADDAAQDVFFRLLRELEQGKTYPVPYRVVVGMVVQWTCNGYYVPAKQDSELPESDLRAQLKTRA